MWVKQAILKGLTELDTPAFQEQVAYHMLKSGEWEQEVISPSLLSTSCRLQRLKKFYGHGYQPGKTHMAARQGRPDPGSNLTFQRGFWAEGVVVTAIKAAGVEVIAGAPTLVAAFDEGEWRWRGHPDLIVRRPSDGTVANIQIKCPSVFKLAKQGPESSGKVPENYFLQVATEMYILRRMGLPVDISYLAMISAEPIPPSAPKTDQPIQMAVFELGWHDGLIGLVEAVAGELKEDVQNLREREVWPEPIPVETNDWRCRYCSFARVATVNSAACHENHKWQALKGAA